MGKRHESHDDPRSGFGSAPESVHPSEDEDTFRERCLKDRESLSPRESADCAGSDLAELYENEEDGGS